MTSTGTVLDEIIVGVREDMEGRRSRLPESALRDLGMSLPPARDARAALIGDGSSMGLIAEVKRASPSKGALADIPDPARLASLYAQAGASVISVLTEQRRFRGSLADLDAVRERVETPILRKDFIVDPYQVHEARAHGADLVLLMASALPDARLEELHELVESLGMQSLVEVHDAPELDRALALDAGIIGVNARDLKSLEVDLDRAAQLIAQVPAGPIVVGESAVTAIEDVRAYATSGADAVLVGEALVTGDDPGSSVRAFRCVTRGPGRSAQTKGIPS